MSLAVLRTRAWSCVAYERIIDAGGFSPDFRVELPDGEIIDL
jgi:hypothetical protein